MSYSNFVPTVTTYMGKSTTPLSTKNAAWQYNPQYLPPIDWSQPNAAQDAYNQLLTQFQFLWQRVNSLNGISGKQSFVVSNFNQVVSNTVVTMTNGILTNVTRQ